MTDSPESGQISLLAIIALALMVVFIMYSMLGRQQAEQEVSGQTIRSASLREEFEKVRSSIQGILEHSVHQAASEMASHGGFTRENVPSLNHAGVPYWFYKGHVVNVPSTKVIEQMLAQEIERTVKDRIRNLARKHGLDARSFGFPHTNVTLTSRGIAVHMNLAVRLTDDTGTAGTEVTFVAHSPLRLALLRDIAAYYVENYTHLRVIEDALFDSISTDPRIPSPFGEVGMEVPCDAPLDLKINALSDDGYPLSDRQDLVGPFREHTVITSAIAASHVRDADFGGAVPPDMDAEDVAKAMEYVEWSFEPAREALTLAFVANEDYPDRRSNETIYFFDPMEVGMTRPRMCMSGYQVNYSIHFPVKVIVRDLLPSGQVVGAAGSSTVKPLEFAFYMELAIQNEQPTVDPSVDVPASIDDACQGGCSITVELDPPDIAGALMIDACRYPDGTIVSGTTWHNVPCGIHDVVFEADEPGYARSAERMNIDESTPIALSVRRMGAVNGKVYVNYTVLCDADRTLREWSLEPLGYVEGKVPAYIELSLVPTDQLLSQLLVAVTDADGSFSFPVVNPGKYLLLALSSRDPAGRPLYLVLPHGRIVNVADGSQELEPVVMKAMSVERDAQGRLHHVAYRDGGC